MIQKPSEMERHFLNLMHTIHEDYQTAIGKLTAQLQAQQETISEQERRIEALENNLKHQDQVLSDLTALLER